MFRTIWVMIIAIYLLGCSEPVKEKPRVTPKTKSTAVTKKKPSRKRQAEMVSEKKDLGYKYDAELFTPRYSKQVKHRLKIWEKDSMIDSVMLPKKYMVLNEGFVIFHHPDWETEKEVFEIDTSGMLQKLELNPHCGCNLGSEKWQVVRCDTTHLSNGAMLYWNWNCDSLWWTFENSEKLKVILNSCTQEESMHCTINAGLTFIKEYPDYLFFIHRWASGCCNPVDLIFVNKETGQEFRRVGMERFLWGDSDDDYAIYFSDTTYTELEYWDLLKAKKQVFDFTSYQLNKSRDINNPVHHYNLFSDFEKIDNQLTFNYKNVSGEIVQVKLSLK